MPLPIVQADLVARIGEAEVDRYAKAAGDSSVEDRIAEAWDAITSAAGNTFTQASIDALTAGTVPPEMKRHAVSLAIRNLVSGSKHPDYLDDAAAQATEYLKFLASGTVHYGDVLVRVTGATGGARARVGTPPARVFDPASTAMLNRHRIT